MCNETYKCEKIENLKWQKYKIYGLTWKYKICVRAKHTMFLTWKYKRNSAKIEKKLCHGFKLCYRLCLKYELSYFMNKIEDHVMKLGGTFSAVLCALVRKTIYFLWGLPDFCGPIENVRYSYKFYMHNCIFMDNFIIYILFTS